MLRNNKLKDILGLNRRNQEYIRPLNPPSAKRIADNKILTKKILSREGIKTPEVYKLIRSKKQLQFLDFESLPMSFVIKPNQGTGGNGIVVLYGKKKGQSAWIRPSGEIMTAKDITIHIENILEGRYSMGSKKDIAIIEERVKTDPFLKQFSYKGVPDIRIIGYNEVPIMAMMRLPTKRSNGTANLHSGAICTGIDISSGITTYSMHMKDKSIMSDSYEMIDATTDLKENKKLGGIQIPYWEEILEIAVKCQKASKLGYIGVDIALDAEKGPVVFELNARPGLGIQVANQAGLRWRLEKVKGIEIKNMKHGIRVAKNLFGGEIEESIEAISGRKVININEKVFLYYKTPHSTKKDDPKNREAIRVFVDTGMFTSRINKNLSTRLGFFDAIDHFFSQSIPKKFESFKEAQEYIDSNQSTIMGHPDILRIAKIVEEGAIRIRPVISTKIRIAGETKEIEMVVTQDTTYNVVIGRNELKGYLIDTSKTFK